MTGVLFIVPPLSVYFRMAITWHNFGAMFSVKPAVTVSGISMEIRKAPNTYALFFFFTSVV